MNDQQREWYYKTVNALMRIEGIEQDCSVLFVGMKEFRHEVSCSQTPLKVRYLTILLQFSSEPKLLNILLENACFLAEPETEKILRESIVEIGQ